ncbi:glycosyltransferase [Iocasia frigidifontis]|nr:glycosyltransferase [Iocasia fonsfrigidae]
MIEKMDINDIFKIIGYTPPDRTNLNSTGLVSIITSTNKTEYSKNIFMNYNQQNYQDKELIIILNNNNLDIQKWQDYSKSFQNVQVFQLDESTTLGSCLNFAIEKSKGDYIAKFDDDDYYGPNYLIDQINCFSDVNTQIIGRVERFMHFPESKILGIANIGVRNCFHNWIIGPSPVIKRDVFNKVKFNDINRGEDQTFFRKCLKVGFKLYTGNPFNYVQIRHRDLNKHTMKVSVELSQKACKIIAITDNFKPLVTM